MNSLKYFATIDAALLSLASLLLKLIILITYMTAGGNCWDSVFVSQRSSYKVQGHHTRAYTLASIVFEESVYDQFHHYEGFFPNQ